MKRTIFLVTIMISMISSAFPQNSECIYCGSNELIETSSAIGNLNQNLGEFSLTIGNSNKIAQKLQLVTLIGYNNIANGNLIGNYSGAFGINNLIQSDKSYIIGNEDTVSATGAISIGSGSRVSGLYSISIGLNTKAYGNYSVAIGNRAIAKAMNSYSFGNNVWSDANGSITIGTSPIYLKNTTPNSLIIGFNSSVATLFVGVSNGSGTTGKVGIGNVTEPETKLHIKADSNEDAILKLEPTGVGKIAKLIMGTNDYYLSASAGNNLIFRTPSGKNFSFENGKIVAYTLQISTGFGSGKLLQSDASGNALWTNPAWTISGSNVYRLAGKVGIGTSVLNNPLEVQGHANTSAGYKVGNSEVINSTKDYAGNHGTFNGALTVTGNSSLNGNVGIGKSPNTNKLTVNGTVEATSFSGDGTGLTNVGDNLGNHTATQNIKVSGKWLSGDGDNEGLSINNGGFVGIGTINPQASLQVDGNVRFLSGNQNNQLQILSGNQIPQRRGITLTDDIDGAFNFYIHRNQNQAAFNFKDGLDDSNLMTIKKDGNVGIGTTTINGYKLAVAGKILATELQIQLVEDWYDNVFEEEYNLMDLNELESFVKQNNHLPDIPSEAEVKENGISVGEMNALLLKKVEELTLYIIEQQKALENQQNEIKTIKALLTK